MQLHPSVRRVLFDNELQLGQADGVGWVVGARSSCGGYFTP